MRLLLIIASLLLSSVTFAQGPLVLSEFKGLNTRAGEFQIRPNEARIAHNIDWGRRLGSITKRPGYDQAFALNGVDSIVGLYPAYFSDGTQRMFYVVDPDSTAYGQVKVSSTTSPSSVTAAWDYFSILERPSFAMLNDVVYMANGTQKGLAWREGVTRPFPLNAPGEPTIIPYHDQSNAPYYFSGEYRYVYFVSGWQSGFVQRISSIGYVSQPVRVTNGRCVIRDFQSTVPDSLITAFDSINIWLLRSKANPGALDFRDSVFTIGTIGCTLDTLSSAIFIDSIPDDSLSPVSYYHFLINNHFIGRDSLGALGPPGFQGRAGAPGFMAINSTITYDSAYGDTSPWGLFCGIPIQNDTLGVAYVCTFIDTVTGVMSDTGRALFIFNDTNSLAYSVTINLPKPPDNLDGVLVNLYRALIYQVGYDTGSYWDWNWTKHEFRKQSPFVDTTNPFYRQRANPVFYSKQQVWVDPSLVVDTVVASDFFFVDQFNADDTLYTDSIRYDSLATHDRYTGRVAPAFLNGIFTFDARLYGYVGSRLYFSKLDSAFAFGAFDFIDINGHDGDEITAAYPSRTAIRVLKNKANFNVFQDANLNWNRVEVSGDFGCIAPRSHSPGFGADYYLSDIGVIKETEGVQLERSSGFELLSVQLTNFDSLSIADRRDAVGFYHDNKYLLTVGDTTYVYDEIAKAWSTWSMPIYDAVTYGAETTVDFFYADSMYFLKSGDTGVYRFGTGRLDDGEPVPVVWRSGPFFQTDLTKQIERVGLWRENAESVNDFTFTAYDEDGLSVNQQDVANITKRHSYITFPAIEALYYSVGFTYNYENSWKTPMTIDRIDVYPRILGQKTLR